MVLQLRLGADKQKNRTQQVKKQQENNTEHLYLGQNHDFTVISI